MKPVREQVMSARVRRLPPYLFDELSRIRRVKEQGGTEVIDLSIGDPDLGAPAVVVEALKKYAGEAQLHCYTPHRVVEAFNRAVARWMRERFAVDLDPETEIFPVIGTKEGLAHLPLAIMDVGDLAFVPDPSYPVYARGVWFAGGNVEWMPLAAQRGFLPDMVVSGGMRPRVVFLNYPNNPTSAVADLGFYRTAIEFAGSVGALLANDAAYSEICFDGYHCPSILQVPGAKALAVEFHSFSKTFNMAGWRLGFVAGCGAMISALRTLKSNIDSNAFAPIMMAGISALEDGWGGLEATLKEYARRRAIMFDCLMRCGVGYHRSPASLYIWATVPEGYTSLDFARMLLEKAGVLVAPGVGFGSRGEGYFRISVTCPTWKVEHAAERLEGVSSFWRR